MATGERRTYRPGSRNGNFRNDRNEDKMSENRLVWVRTVMGQAVLMYYGRGVDPESDEPVSEKRRKELDDMGPSVRLFLPRPNARTIIFDITSLTLDELVKLREFYNLLFDLAEPSVRLRDKVAQDAFNNGDDSYTRSYRPLGEAVVRQRSLGVDSKSVQNRLDSFLERTGGYRSNQGGVRVLSSELANSKPEEGSTKDDGSQVDEP